jgi:hypothetical protein
MGFSHTSNYDNMDTEDKSQYQMMLRAKNRETAERFEYYEMKKEVDKMDLEERVNVLKLEKENEQLAECTFKPNLNQKSLKMVSSRSKSSLGLTAVKSKTNLRATERSNSNLGSFVSPRTKTHKEFLE